MKTILILIVIGGVLFAIFAEKHRYDVAGFDNNTAVDKLAANLKSAILAKKPNIVAQNISYPITIYLDGKEKHIIKNKKEFTALYARIFYPDFVKRIKKTKTEGMFARWNGVMLGEQGEIWIGSLVGIKTPLVIAINNEIWGKK